MKKMFEPVTKVSKETAKEMIGAVELKGEESTSAMLEIEDTTKSFGDIEKRQPF